MKKDFGEARTLLEKGCEGKHGASCYDLAVMHQNGEGTPKDKDMAKKFFKVSCELKYENACKYAK